MDDCQNNSQPISEPDNFLRLSQGTVEALFSEAGIKEEGDAESWIQTDCRSNQWPTQVPEHGPSTSFTSVVPREGLYYGGHLPEDESKPSLQLKSHEKAQTCARNLDAQVKQRSNFSFNITCHNYGRSHSVSCVYSSSRNKVYVRMGKPCALTMVLKTEGVDSDTEIKPTQVVIKAQLVFGDTVDKNKPVERCPNHVLEEQKSPAKGGDDLHNPLLSGHVLRVMHANGCQHWYEKGCAVTVSRILKKAETSFQVIYGFKCFSSCAGINRKPLKLVIALLIGGDVAVERELHVKICANPVRDKELDDKMDAERGTKRRRVQGEPVPIAPKANPSGMTMVDAVESSKVERPKLYTVHVYGEENYQTIKRLAEKLNREFLSG